MIQVAALSGTPLSEVEALSWEDLVTFQEVLREFHGKA